MVFLRSMLTIVSGSMLVSAPALAADRSDQPDAVKLVQQYIQDRANRPLSTPKNVSAANGPRIVRVKASQFDAPKFETVIHPQAAPGEKIVVIPLQRTKNGNFELDKFQVGVTFTVTRETDSCNHVKLQGDVTELPVPGRTYLHYTKLELRKEATQITLRGCDDPRKTSRQVEINTDLKAVREFRDNLVFYVPEDVTVTAQVWQAVRNVKAVAPEAVTEDFGPSELGN